MTTLSSHHHAQLQIIYDAYDRIYDIASHRWHPFSYYVPDLKMSNLFGHYVRSLDRFKDQDPRQISTADFMLYSRPLVDAIDSILRLILTTDPDGADIQAIAEGRSLIFRHDHSTYHRCMAAFNCIEKAFPRATHRDGGKAAKKKPSPAKTFRKPNPTVKWLPYKD